MTPDEAIPEIELEVEDEADSTVYPDTLSCPEGQIHFGVDAQTFLEHWLAKLGLESTGGALVVGEGCSMGIHHPMTGEVLTPEKIAKLASSGKVRSIQ